jgi:pimeloyl-ACP methyl ester carboxylesterase
MDRPRLLLISEWTEVEWIAIRPQLEEWADVASFEPPWLGDEAGPDSLDRNALVALGLEELDRRGWERCFVVADGWSNSSAVRLALARPEAVAGMILGHARLSHRKEGDRAPINRPIWEALNELAQKDHEEFMLHGFTQVTGGSVSEDVARQMMDRYPHELISSGFELLTPDDDELEGLMAGLRCPLLLAKHDGCLMATDEGFEDAAAALPHAKTVSVRDAPLSSDEFATAIRDFCEGIEVG